MTMTQQQQQRQQRWRSRKASATTTRFYGPPSSWNYVLIVTTLSFWTILSKALADEGAEIDPSADFQGYMEEKEKQDTAREKYNAMVDEHEVWRQTTWAGWVVRQLQAVGNHFAPFFMALAEILQGETEDTPAAFVLTLILRVLVIAAYIVAAYAIARIINNVFGQEIVMEEEVVIELDDDDEDDGDETKKDQ